MIEFFTPHDVTQHTFLWGWNVNTEFFHASTRLYVLIKQGTDNIASWYHAGNVWRRGCDAVASIDSSMISYATHNCYIVAVATNGNQWTSLLWRIGYQKTIWILRNTRKEENHSCLFQVDKFLLNLVIILERIYHITMYAGLWVHFKNK